MNYLVVLFKNKEKRKIINKFITYERALNFYKEKLKVSDEVIFPKLVENGFDCSYELGLIQIGVNNKEKIFVKDNLGRNIKVDIEDGYSIVKITNYNIEEEFWDYTTKKKITTQDFIKNYLSKSGVKFLSKLNNKIVLQNDDKTNIFTFKNVSDADRFIDILEMKLNRQDCIMVKDYSTIHRKYLYNILKENGFSISYLQRYLTTHPSKK
jgi:hypothetical protein